jgi:ABC-2 type transport system permease protein
MVIATPSFILSGFTWPLSQMPVCSGHFQCDSSHHFLKALVLIIENGTFSKLPVLFEHGYYWTICGILSYIALYLKEKMF